MRHYQFTQATKTLLREANKSIKQQQTTDKVKQKQEKKPLTSEQVERSLEAMNVIYLCTEIIDMAWTINQDLDLGNPNINKFNKNIHEYAVKIKSFLHCKPKDNDMAEERAIELYRALNILSQYHTDELQEFNNRVETECLTLV